MNQFFLDGMSGNTKNEYSRHYILTEILGKRVVLS